MPEKAVERRKTRRFSMRLAVRVQGRDSNGTKWEEMTTSEDASAGGVAVTLKHPCRVGQCLRLTLPLPSRFRQYDLTESSYRVYGLVRDKCLGNRYGMLFLGKHPPRGAESLPSGVFLMPGDPRPLAVDRHGFEVTLHLDAEHAPGGVAQEERTIAENVEEWTAVAKTTRLPVLRGATITVEEVDGDFKTRAEVKNVTIGKDGSPRLDLLFLDEPVPERLRTPVGRKEPPARD